MIKRQNVFVICFLGICLGFCLGIIATYLLNNNTPPPWDEAYHLKTGIEYANFLVSARLSDFLFSYKLYPPFGYQIFAVLQIVTNSPKLVPLLINLFLLGLICYLLFRQTLFESLELKSVFFSKLLLCVTTFFVVLTFSLLNRETVHNTNIWSFMFDFQAAFWVVIFNLSVLEYLLRKNKLWKKLPLFIALSAYAALSTRSQVFPYLFLPLLVFGTAVLRRRDFFAGLVLVSFLLFCSLWYLINGGEYLDYLNTNMLDSSRYETGLKGIFHYLFLLYRHTFWSVWAFIGSIFFLSVSYAHTWYQSRIKFPVLFLLPSLFLISNAVFGLVLFAQLSNQEVRFILSSVLLLYLGLSYILVQLSKHSTTFLLLFFAGLGAYIFAFHFPMPQQAHGAYPYVAEHFVAKGISETTFYFENDWYSFSTDNVQMLHALKGLPVVLSNNPNRWASKFDQTACYIGEKSRYFVIYTKYGGDARSASNLEVQTILFPVTITCKKTLLRNGFRLKDELYFSETQEGLQIYERVR